jgi:hypothetical protein
MTGQRREGEEQAYRRARQHIFAATLAFMIAAIALTVLYVVPR